MQGDGPFQQIPPILFVTKICFMTNLTHPNYVVFDQIIFMKFSATSPPLPQDERKLKLSEEKYFKSKMTFSLFKSGIKTIKQN